MNPTLRLLEPGLLTAIALTAIAAIVPELFMPGYYHWDDNMHLFLPTMYEIGTHLRSGHMPWITDRSWFGGNLLGEGQFALFNPVSLTLYATISTSRDASLASLVFAVFHLCLMAAGMHRLARNVGLSDRLSACAGFAFTCSNQVSYWYAAGWWNALVADAWLVFALAFWVRYLNDGKGLLAATVLGAISMLSGWPHGWLALGTCIALFSFVAYRNGESAKALKILAGGLLTLVAASPGIVPTLVYSMQSVRLSQIKNEGDMIGTLEALIMSSWPSLISATQRIYNWKPELPLYYSAWFVLPALVFFGRNWLDQTSVARKSLLLLPLAAFALLSLSPERILMLRWSMRFLPYFNLFLILIALDAIGKQESAQTPLRARMVLAMGLFGFYYCLMNSAGGLSTHVAFTALWIAATVALVACIRHLSENAVATSVLLSTFVIFVATHETWPRNTNLPNWHGPSEVNLEIFERQSVPFSHNVLLVHSSPSPRKIHSLADLSPLQASLESSNTMPSGAIAMWSIDATINGYSAIPHKGLKEFYCFNNWGHSHCPDVLKRLFSFDPDLGIRYDRLYRIDELRIRRDLLGKSNATIPDDWKQVNETEDTLVYRTTHASNRNLSKTTIGHAAEGLIIESQELAEINNEVFTVSNPTDASRKLVFARPFYPGYTATLNGKPLEVSLTSDVFLTADIPAHASGTLKLSFLPPYFGLTAGAALLALALAFLLSRSSPPGNSKSGRRDIS